MAEGLSPVRGPELLLLHPRRPVTNEYVRRADVYAIVVILARPDDGGVPRDGNRIAEKVGPEFLLL